MTALYAITALALCGGAIALWTVRRSGAAWALGVALGAEALLVGRNVAWDLEIMGWLFVPGMRWVSIATFLLPPLMLGVAVRRAQTGEPWQASDLNPFKMIVVLALGLVGLEWAMGDAESFERLVATLVTINALAVAAIVPAFRLVRELPTATQAPIRAVLIVFCVHWLLSMGAWAASLSGANTLADVFEAGSVASLLVFGLGAALLGLRRVASAVVSEHPPTSVLDQASVADPRDADLIEALSRALDEDHVYLDPDLTVDALASRIRATTRDTSRLLVAEFGGFHDAVGHRRVAHAQRLLRAEPGATVLDVLHRSGFSSTSAFHRAFKSRTNTTPGGYREHLAELRDGPFPVSGRQDGA